MNTNELRQKSPEELTRMMAQLHESIRDMRFKIATRQHTKVRSLREAKKSLARILTILRELPQDTGKTSI